MDYEINRINIGCGATPTTGWHNYDNSLSVRLAHHPMLTLMLNKCELLAESQKEFILAAKNKNIVWVNAAKRIPLPESSVDTLYTSHMIEHLDQEEVKNFLKEVHRILTPNGIVRIAVPDLKKLVEQYIASGDADAFVRGTHLTRDRMKTFFAKLKYFIIGDRHHQWMYDGPSMIHLLSSMDFRNPRVLQAGSTTIPDPGDLNLRERENESVYVEASNW